MKILIANYKFIKNRYKSIKVWQTKLGRMHTNGFRRQYTKLKAERNALIKSGQIIQKPLKADVQIKTKIKNKSAFRKKTLNIQNHINILDVISKFVELKPISRNLHRGLCPFHSEKTPSFTVYQDSQSYHCFGCQAHGNVIGFLIQKDNCDFKDAIHQLRQNFGL